MHLKAQFDRTDFLLVVCPLNAFVRDKLVSFDTFHCYIFWHQWLEKGVKLFDRFIIKSSRFAKVQQVCGHRADLGPEVFQSRQTKTKQNH